MARLIRRFLHTLRAFLMLTALLMAIMAVIVLLNFTALNPTGRRYSSGTPLLTGQGQAKEIGNSAEAILARDLQMENNNTSGKQCFCNDAFASQPVTGDCGVCVAYLPEIAHYRIPDFISGQFIADSKNEKRLYPNLQLQHFMLAAIALDRPLWIYVRVNTIVDPRLETMIDLTGGGVVYYFTVPGFVDPVDQAAQQALIVSVIVFGGCLFTFPIRRRRVVSVRPPAPAHPSQRKPHKPGTLRDAEAFASSSRQRAWEEIDRYTD